MDAPTSPDRPNLAGRILGRVLDPRKKLDLVWIAVFAAWPMLHAWLLGAHADTTDGFQGYWGQANWVLLIALLPLAVHLFRVFMQRVAPVAAAWPPPEMPAIVALIATDEGRQHAYADLRARLLSTRTLLTAFFLTLAVQAADMSELIGFALAAPTRVCSEAQHGHDRSCAVLEVTAGEAQEGDDGAAVRNELVAGGHRVEKDWSVMFVSADLPEAGPGTFVPLIASAYAVQFALLMLAILLVVLLFAHNLFFLARIYQRRRVTPGTEADYIHIDLDDDDKCFGFRRANDAFNTQVLALAIAAIFTLVTRFSNVTPGSGLFPDTGQWLVVIVWLGSCVMIMLPVAVKLLPRLPSTGARRPDSSITGYLREYLSDDAWASGDAPPSEEINAVAARFAQNAFWPTGNNRARQLFFVSFWVFFVALVPDARAIQGLDGMAWTRFAAWGLSAGLAWIATRLVFAVLNGLLAYIDERLVKLPPGGIPEVFAEPKRRIPIGLFISYRRDDTAPYAGRLRDSLSDQIDEERIFMDVDTIAGGADFQVAIEEAIESAHAMLVMIGPDWLAAREGEDTPRIQLEKDFVRMEIALGLRAGIGVFPVLVGDAQMPAADDLPPDLRMLVRLNASEVSNSRWDHDVGKLLEDLESYSIPKKPGQGTKDEG